MKTYNLKIILINLLLINSSVYILAQQPANDNMQESDLIRIRQKAALKYHKLANLKQQFNGEQRLSSNHHVLFGWPMRAAENYVDQPNYYSTVNYWDLGSGSSEVDWQCNGRTYDGHNGVDIALFPFWWRMKDNFNVYAVAAAPGLVVEVQNGYADERCVLASNTSNFIAIMHTDSSISYYVHLKVNGMLVSEDDIVYEGQAIAYIASSGRSTYPHLHFQVEDENGNNIEPFKNSSPDCNTLNSDSWWQNQKPYWEPRINRIATHYGKPALWGPDSQSSDYWCKDNEEPKLKNNFSPLDSIYLAYYFQDLQTNDDWTITLRQPDGTAVFTDSRTHTGSPRPFTYFFNGYRFASNAPSGTWRLAVSYRSVTYVHFLTVNCISFYSLSSQTGDYGRIASDNIQSTAVASSGDEVRLQAGNYIEFKPGFRAAPGSTLKARIRSCSSVD